MKVKNVGSNMTEVEVNGKTVLFSYETPVAANTGSGFVKTEKYHSVTTGRHINKWLGGAKAKEVSQEELDNMIS